MKVAGTLLIVTFVARTALAAGPQGPPKPAAVPPTPPPPPAVVAAKTAAPTLAMNPPTELEAPPKAGVPALSLAEAVRLTVLHDPRLGSERQRVGLSMGQLREAEGRFDQLFTSGPSYAYTTDEISTFFSQREDFKRELLRRLAQEFRLASSAIAVQLAANNLAPPQCPEGFSIVTLGENEFSDIGERTGIVFEDTIVELPADLTRGQDQFFNLCRPPNDLGATPESTLNVLRSINDAAQLGLGPQLVQATQLPLEALTLVNDVADAVAIKAQLAFDRLGAIPIDEASESLSFKANYSKLFRSGLLLQTDLKFSGSERNFINKSIDPAFGGFGSRNEFPSSVNLSFTVPLGKARGRVATGAPERAANFSLQAQRETLREAVSEEVFSTVLSYISLQAAQQSLALTEESSARQKRLVDLSEQLVRGGELAGSELDRIRARATLVLSQVADARRTLLQSRVNLAQAIGLSVDTLADAPLAADAFPKTIAPTAPVPVLLDRALSTRRKLRAASSLEDASLTLTKAARADLKRRVDLTVSGGFNTLYESHFLRVLPEEQPIQPYINGVRFSDPTGFRRSFGMRWEPGISANLVFDLPFKNNTAHGRLLQEQSSYRTSQIQHRDIERTIRDNVVTLEGQVRRARETVARNEETTVFYEKTLQSALERFQAGDITLIDTLTTEDDLTRQKQQSLRALQNYLNLLARLKFETGELITFEQEGDRSERAGFEPAPFIAQ